MMSGYPTLQTERLTLRRFRLTDVDDVLAYANDERYLLPLPYPYERVHAEQFVAESFLSDWKSKTVFAIVLDDVVIGSISLSIGKESQVGSIGLRHRAKALGKWLLDRSGSCRRRLGFRGVPLGQGLYRGECRKQAVVASDGASRHDREGIHRSQIPDGHDSNGRQDMACYGILREEWERQS